MAWGIISFGNYQGISIPQLVFKDPDYFFWAMENDVFNGTYLVLEAKDVYKKSRNIKIPKFGHKAEYVTYKGKFQDIKLVPIERPAHIGSSSTFREDKIDMGFVRETKGYDKRGGEILIHSLKSILFGSSNYRMSKKRCEDFFENPSNFTL
ncbi:hypothetical protein AM499_00910 [Bacillus sp. FJAT-22090]|uniref:hypothetical protein n=1 Tax=Bacillus sp. FJAT-22090 TaxID=1581038 RepID=UPI0006AF40B6|nr:hypothetical protein [Bacillus sp. FJAT-22090]ALC84540.1 hypothetical protein AM499_00910 [Bacillus sp. FJAT-22090]